MTIAAIMAKKKIGIMVPMTPGSMVHSPLDVAWAIQPVSDEKEASGPHGGCKFFHEILLMIRMARLIQPARRGGGAAMPCPRSPLFLYTRKGGWRQSRGDLPHERRQRG